MTLQSRNAEGADLKNSERNAMAKTMSADLRGYDALREIACREVSVNYVPRRASLSATPELALRDIYSPNLSVSWDIEELSAVIAPQLRHTDRPIFEGQKRASGRELAPLPRG